MTYLIDADIIIFSLKNHPAVINNFSLFRDIPKSLSVISYGEMIYGARKSSRVDKNLATARRIGELFPLINLTPAIMETFGELKANLGFKG